MNKLLVAAVALGVLVGAQAEAHEVQPMIVNIAPSGATANFRLMVKNTETVPITLEIEPMRVTVDAQGEPTRTPENDDIILFPPQVIVPPGAEQAVQVQYVGDPAIAAARIYAVEVRQLPIAFATNTSTQATTEVKVAFNFISHVIVSPPGAHSAVSVTSQTRAADGDLSFIVANKGSGVALLKDTQWIATDAAGTKTTLDIDTLDFGGFAALLPETSRTIVAPAAALADLVGDVSVAAVTP